MTWVRGWSAMDIRSWTIFLACLSRSSSSLTRSRKSPCCRPFEHPCRTVCVIAQRAVIIFWLTFFNNRYTVTRQELDDLYGEAVANNLIDPALKWNEEGYYKLCDDKCVNMSSSVLGSCGSLGCMMSMYQKLSPSFDNSTQTLKHSYGECMNYDESILRGCYCQNKLDEATKANGALKGRTVVKEGDDADICAEYECRRGAKRRAVRTPAAPPPGTLRTPRRGHHTV